MWTNKNRIIVNIYNKYTVIIYILWIKKTRKKAKYKGYERYLSKNL